MSKFDEYGNEWDYFNGEPQLIGYDRSKIKIKSSEDKIKTDQIFAKYDEQKRKDPPPEPRRNILLDFINQLTAEIEFSAIIEKTSGRKTEFK